MISNLYAAERLRLALAQLDARQAEVFCLARIEGMSYGEIAERLTLSVSNVGVLLNRARTALRRRLRDECRQGDPPRPNDLAIGSGLI